MAERGMRVNHRDTEAQRSEEKRRVTQRYQRYQREQSKQRKIETEVRGWGERRRSCSGLSATDGSVWIPASSIAFQFRSHSLRL
jgi:hypothetical protein